MQEKHSLLDVIAVSNVSTTKWHFVRLQRHSQPFFLYLTFCIWVGMSALGLFFVKLVSQNVLFVDKKPTERSNQSKNVNVKFNLVRLCQTRKTTSIELTKSIFVTRVFIL